MESQANQRTKVIDWLNVDRAQLLDKDLKSTIKSTLKYNLPPSSVNHQNQLNARSKIPNKELVKYMSNLPSYLETGDTLGERALSFGVLDWQSLEKWQQDRKKIFYPSCSNDSSCFSTDLSSTFSRQGQSYSPAETAVKEVDEFQELGEKMDKPAKREHILYGKYQSFIKLQENKLKQCERENIEVQSIRKRKPAKFGDLSSGITHDNPEKGSKKLLNDDLESNPRIGIKPPGSKKKLLSESLESPSHTCKNIEDMLKTIFDGSGKINILEDHKVRNGSPNHKLSFGLNSPSLRSNSLKSSKPVQSKNQLKKDVEYSGLKIGNLRKSSPTHIGIGLNRCRHKSRSVDFSNESKLSSQRDPNLSKSTKEEGFHFKLSCHDNLDVERKSQMSPLRRLLDPLLNLKAPSSAKYSENLYPQMSEPFNEKHKPSTVQALMQFSIKNGLPLFTFTDDKNSSVLAATMKKENTLGKGESSWIYTFFNVNEVKKKSNWMNKGCKSNTLGYFPSIIGKMRVSENRHDTIEFVSFSVDASRNDQKIYKFQPKDELVAILINFSKDHLLCNKVKMGSNKLSDPLIKVTAILPGSSHGLPSNGKPSPLIERWKSGGLCDCGGWDLGCRLKVLTSQAEYDRSNFSNTFQAAERFELFHQEEVAYKQPVFIVTPFKANAYTVEFDSSLSFLQAFSIGISILNCRKTLDLSERFIILTEDGEKPSSR